MMRLSFFKQKISSERYNVGCAPFSLCKIRQKIALKEEKALRFLLFGTKND